MTKRRRNGQGAPEPGAIQVSRFTTDLVDSFEAVAGWYRANGWTVVERDYAILPNGELVEGQGARPLVRVVLWAVPPRKEAEA
jgi:hypothetical protein